jgi:hypothetical protein
VAFWWIHLGRFHGHPFGGRPLADRLCALRFRLHAIHAQGYRPAGRVLGHLRRVRTRFGAAHAARRAGGRRAAHRRHPRRALNADPRR